MEGVHLKDYNFRGQQGVSGIKLSLSLSYALKQLRVRVEAAQNNFLGLARKLSC
jgi:hypothetical protein